MMELGNLSSALLQIPEERLTSLLSIGSEQGELAGTGITRTNTASYRFFPLSLCPLSCLTFAGKYSLNGGSQRKTAASMSDGKQCGDASLDESRNLSSSTTLVLSRGTARCCSSFSVVRFASNSEPVAGRQNLERMKSTFLTPLNPRIPILPQFSRMIHRLFCGPGGAAVIPRIMSDPV
jgi:hypothetical protein